MLKLNLRTHQTATTLGGILLMLLALLTGREQALQQTIMAATLFVMGLLLASYRQRLIVDPARQQIQRKRGFAFLLHCTTISTQGLSQLTLREKVIRSGKSERTWYQLLADKTALICQLKDPLHARTVAETLAKVLLLPLDNHIHGVRSLRSPQQLDLPVAARWQAAHVRTELPAAPAHSRIEVVHSAAGTRITLPAEHENLKLVALLAAVVLAIGVLLYSLAKAEDLLFLTILFVPFLFFLLVAVLAFSGRSAIQLTASHITVRQGLSPFRKRLPLKDVEEFIKARDGIILDGDKGSAWIHWAGSKEESHYLEALLAYELARRG